MYVALDFEGTPPQNFSTVCAEETLPRIALAGTFNFGFWKVLYL